jgi:hypothetical protein
MLAGTVADPAHPEQAGARRAARGRGRAAFVRLLSGAFVSGAFVSGAQDISEHHGEHLAQPDRWSNGTSIRRPGRRPMLTQMARPSWTA